MQQLSTTLGVTSFKLAHLQERKEGLYAGIWKEIEVIKSSSCVTLL